MTSSPHSLFFAPPGSFNQMEAPYLNLKEASPKERTNKIVEIANSVILQNPQREIKWKTFALTAAEFSVRFKSLAEGGLAISVVCNFWLSILYSWKQGQGIFFKDKISNTDLAKLISYLKNIQSLELIASNTQTPFQATARQLLKQLQTDLKDGPTYMALTYRGGNAQAGHAYMLKVEEQGDKVILTLFNRGAGSELHPIVNITSNARLPSIRYFPIAVDKAVFFGEEGKIAFGHLVHYMQAPAPDTGSLYEAWEIYSILQTLGTPIANFTNFNTTYAKEQQITGNCSVAAIEHLMLDALVDFGYSDLKIQKIMLNLHLCFLIQAHLEFLRNPLHSYHAFVQESASLLGTDLQAIENQISQAEFIYTACTLIHISSVNPPIPPSLEISLPPQEPISMPPIVFTKVGDFYEPYELSESQLSVKEPLWPLPEFQPETALSYFEKVNCILEQLRRNEKEDYFDAVLTALPLPLYGEKGPWDATSEKELLPLLKQLKRFVVTGMSEKSFKHSFGDFCKMGIIYCIADALVRRKIPELNTYASSFLFLDSPRVHEPPNASSGPLNRAYTAVYRYFQKERKLSDNKSREVIFPIEKFLPVEEELSLMVEGHNSICSSHLRFLSQFVGQTLMGIRDLDAFVKIWKGQGLPEEVNLLYYFSFLTHFVYHAKTYERGLPSTLSFEEKTINETRFLAFDLPKKTTFAEGTELNSKLFMYSDTVREIDTNQAALAKKENFPDLEDPLSGQQLSELFRIWNLSCPHLRFHQALQFMRNHKETATHKTAREIMNYSLLAPRALFEALEHAPEVEKTIRLTFYELIQFYINQPNHRKTLYFLFDLLTLVEINLHEAKAPPPPAEHLRQYIQYLEKEKEYIEKSADYEAKHNKDANLIHTLLMYLLLENKSSSDWSQVIHKCASLNQGNILLIQGWNLNWTSIYEAGPPLKRMYFKQIPEILKLTPHDRNTLCNQVISHYVGSLGNLQWQMTKNSFTSSLYVLDLYNLELLDPSQNPLRKNPAFEVDRDCGKTDVPEYGKWDLQTGEWVSNDGRFKYKKADDNGPTYTQFIKIAFNGEERWMQNVRYLIGFSDEKIVSPVSYFRMDRLAKYEGWVLVDPKENDPHLLICDLKSDTPLFAVYVDPQKPNQYTVKKITPDGLSTSYSIVNLGNVEKLEGLFLKLTLCLPPKDIFCLIDEHTGSIEEIKFLKQKIHFKRNAEGHLECITPHPGFYLDQNFQHEELGSFNGALILKNPFGRRKILMFPRRIQTGFGDKAHKIKLGEPLFMREYLSFELSPYSNDLFTNQPHAYLYLAYVFKAQKSYSKALNYLKKVKFKKQEGELQYPESFEITPVNAFFKIKDGSLESICLNAHLSCTYLHFLRSMEESQFKENQTKYNDKIISKISSNYLEYLRVGGGVHAFVPEEFLLSKEQEKTLLFFLEDYYLEIEEKFPPTFSDRLRLILEYTVEGTIEDHPIPRFIVDFKKLLEKCRISSVPTEEKLKAFTPDTHPLDPCPVRISTPQLIANFFTLYSLACTPDNPSFKYTLLALLHTKDKTNIEYSRLGLTLILTKTFLCKKAMKVDITDLAPAVEKRKVMDQLLEHANSLDKPLLPKDQTFKIKRSFTLDSPFQKERTPVILPSIEFPYVHAPLETLAKHYLIQIPQTKKTLDPLPKINPDSPLEEALDKTLQENQPKFVETPPEIQFKGDPVELGKALLEQKTKNHKQMRKIQNEIRELFAPHLGLETAPFETAQEIQETLSRYLTRQRGTSSPFSPEKIMREVVLKGNPALLLETFPLMTASHAAEIVKQVQHYFHLEVVDVLITTSLDTLESVQKNRSDQELLQKLHTLLSFQFLYNPNHHPEISLMVTKTRLLPREQQIKIHLWQCEQIEKEGSSLFQGGAGLGKSSYLIPLLILRLLKEECIPVVFSSQAMYSIDRENLSSVLSLFGITLDVLEVGMHTQLTLKKLQLIYRNLLVCRDERRPLIVVPQTFYALKLMYQNALKTDINTERVEYLSKICAFTQKHCRLICDESHLVFDANTTAIFGFGELIEESPQVYPLYIGLLYPLLGIESLQVSAEQTAHELFVECQQMSGNEGKETSIYATNIQQLQKALSEKMVPQILPDLSKKEQAAYCEFVYHPELPTPSSFTTLPKKITDQIGYLRFFLTTLLPPLTQMKVGRDHNPSPYPKQDFHTPCHKGVATTTQFLETLQTIVVTIKGVFEKGLQEEQLIAHLSLLALKSSTWKCVNQVDSTDLLSNYDLSFAKWAKNTPFEGRTLASLDFQNPEEKKALTEHFGHNKALITDILQVTILPQIKFPKYQMELTPADLANMGKAFAFSATPGRKETLPTCFNEPLYDHPFTSQVVNAMLQTHNLTQIHPPSLDPASFFNYLKEKKPKTFSKSYALIDLGGAFASLPNQKIAYLWLKASELDGVLFFQKNQSLSINREEKICLLLKNEKVITFEGSRLQEAMTQATLDYKTLRLGVFYDVSHTESADVPILSHHPSFNILLIPGNDDRFTYSNAVQAVMRVRDFLSPTKKRKLIWVFPNHPTLKTRDELYVEMVKNEAAGVRSRILHAAAQEIATVIRASLEAKLSPDTEAEEQIELMQEHEKAFMSERKRDPSKTYCAMEEILAVNTILDAFSLSYYNKCYGNAQIPKKIKKKIQELIARASSLVETASSTALENPDREVEVETEVKEEKRAHLPKPDDPIRAAPIYGKVSIKEEKFIEKSEHYLSTNFFGPTFSRFYFESNQINTAKFYDKQLMYKKLKPIDFFIILFDQEGKVHIRAMVNEIVNTQMQELTETEELPFIGHRALIMTGDGHVVRRGQGLMKPTSEEEERFLKSKEYQNLIIDRAFLEARLPKDLKATIQRIQEWGPSFQEFYNKVLDAQINKEDIETEAFQKIIDIALNKE